MKSNDKVANAMTRIIDVTFGSFRAGDNVGRKLIKRK